MDEERLLILQMLRDGKITVEQAAQLLDALRSRAEPGAAGAPQGAGNRGPEDGAEKAGQTGEAGGEAGGRWEQSRSERGFDQDAFRESMRDMAENIAESVRSAVGDAGMHEDLRRTITEAVDSAMRGVRVGLRGLRDLGSGIGVVIGESLRGVGDLFAEGGTPHISSWSWQGIIPAGGLFALHNPNGDITIEAGDGETASVKAVIRAWEKADGTVPPVPITVEEGGRVVRIRTRFADRMYFGRMPRVDFQVTLPRGVNVEIHTVNGDVSLSGTEAGLELHSVNGDLTARQVTGRLLVHTVNGDVTVDMVHATDIEIHSVNGDAVCRVARPFAGRAEFHTVSGDMVLAVPPQSDFAVEMQAVSGDLDCRLPHVQLERRRRLLAARVGAGTGRVRMKAVSGDLEVREYVSGAGEAGTAGDRTPGPGAGGPASDSGSESPAPGETTPGGSTPGDKASGEEPAPGEADL